MPGYLPRASLAAVAATICGVALAASGAFANDRELLFVLDHVGCTPGHVVRTDASATFVIYQVTCKQSARVLYVTGIEAECRVQRPSRDDDER